MDEVFVTVPDGPGLEIDTSAYGAAIPSVDERIYLSDVVVRAILTGTGDGTLTFAAIEYLKGTGDRTFSIPIATGDRTDRWDDREAVLFLTNSSGSGGGSDTSFARSPSGSAFQFTDTTTWDYQAGYSEASDRVYSGPLPEGIMIGSSNPVWLPSTTEGSGGSSWSRDHTPDHNPDYITESGANPPIVSLADIRSKIAWQQGGDSEEYKTCVRTALAEDRESRDYLAHQNLPGRVFTVPEWSTAVPSGTARGEVYYERWQGDDLYPRFWLEGKDAGLFTSGYEDDDDDATNGYIAAILTARPLPSGEYTFDDLGQVSVFFPCSYLTPHSTINWRIFVEAPAGVVYEALFDPATIGSGDGYISSGDLSTGDLSPATFDVGSTAHTIASLYGTGDAVTMTLSPYNNLAGHTLDFITGDGTTSLSLNADNATGDSTAGTLTWAVGSQPWSSGDQLMLRITEPWFGVRVALSPRQGERQTYTDITISWTDPQTCGSQYFVGLYQGDTPVKIWGYHPAAPTGITRNTGLTWGSDPINTWTARVHCGDDDWRLVGDVPLTSGLP